MHNEAEYKSKVPWVGHEGALSCTIMVGSYGAFETFRVPCIIRVPCIVPALHRSCPACWHGVPTVLPSCSHSAASMLQAESLMGSLSSTIAHLVDTVAGFQRHVLPTFQVPSFPPEPSLAPCPMPGSWTTNGRVIRVRVVISPGRYGIQAPGRPPNKHAMGYRLQADPLISVSTPLYSPAWLDASQEHFGFPRAEGCRTSL